MKPYNLVVVIGRFQLLHNGHIDLLKEAAQFSDNVAVMIGSCDIARDIKNPFNFAERCRLIKLEAINFFDKVHIYGLVDNHYSDKEWALQTKRNVASLEANGSKVLLVGFEKDKSSYYLRMFPEWDFHNAKQVRSLDATTLRTAYFAGETLSLRDIPENTQDFLHQFKRSQDFKNLAEEQRFVKKYKSQFAELPYPPIFTTVDAVVLCGSNVLMVKRGANPGKGLMALPGGFLNHDERVKDGILRELEEETQISKFNKDVSADLLRSSLSKIDYFDAPNRSLRGRTISFGGLIVLERTTLPLTRSAREIEVSGERGVEKSMWIDIDYLRDNPDFIFEDHLSIINRMVGYAR